jgi:myosin heavy subunit
MHIRQSFKTVLTPTQESIAPIASAISKAIAQDITSLSQLISPESRTDLLSKIQKSTQNIATNSQTLSTLRLDLAHNAASLQSLYLKALETSIRLLEQTIHGSISRNTKTKAEYLATVAEGMARKLQIQQNQLFTQTKSTELQEAVSLKSEELEREAMMLKRKVREMGEALAEYRESNAVEGMAREYAEIEGERERVQVDIERLEGESGR